MPSIQRQAVRVWRLLGVYSAPSGHSPSGHGDRLDLVEVYSPASNSWARLHPAMCDVEYAGHAMCWRACAKPKATRSYASGVWACFLFYVLCRLHPIARVLAHHGCYARFTYCASRLLLDSETTVRGPFFQPPLCSEQPRHRIIAQPHRPNQSPSPCCVPLSSLRRHIAARCSRHPGPNHSP